MSAKRPSNPPSHPVTWKLCEPGWWDATRNGTYVGWSVARQYRIRWVKGQPRQVRCGWYLFNDAIGKMIRPFKNPTAAQRSYTRHPA